MREIVLENFPTALAWIKKTNNNYRFTGSFSKNKMFSENALCYRVWACQRPDTEEKVSDIKVCAWIKPAGFDKQDPIDYQEATYPMTDEGLEGAKQFIISRIEANKSYLE